MFKFLIKFLNTQISGEWDELCQVFLKGTTPPLLCYRNQQITSWQVIFCGESSLLCEERRNKEI